MLSASTASARPDSSGRLRWLLGALIAALLVLTGCGVQVGSRVSIDENFAGERIWVIGFNTASVQEQTGAELTEIDQAIQTQLPAPVSFQINHQPPEAVVDAFAGTGNTLDTAEAPDNSATVRMEFSSQDDYQTKISQLLDASGYEGSRELTVQLENTGLSTTVIFEEDYTNQDLLGWIGPALAAEGIVTASQAASIFEGTIANVLELNGHIYESSRAADGMRINEVTDHGFSVSSVELTLGTEAPLAVRVQLSGSTEGSDAEAQARHQYLDQVREQLEQLSGIVDLSINPGDTEGLSRYGNTEITFSATDVQVGSRALGLIFGNEQLSLSLETVADPGSAAVTSTLTGSNFSCGITCGASGRGEALPVEISLPEDWEISGVPADPVTEFTVTATHYQYLESIEVKTELGFTGSITQRYDFQLRDELNDQALTELAELVDPGQGGTTQTDTETRRVTVKITGAELEQFRERLRGFLSLADISRGEQQGFFWPSYRVQMDLSPVVTLVPGGVVEPVVHHIELPFLHRLDQVQTSSPAQAADGENGEDGADTEDGVPADSATFTLTGASALDVQFTAKGPSLAGALTVIGIVLGLVVIVLLVLVLIRISKTQQNHRDPKLQPAYLETEYQFQDPTGTEAGTGTATPTPPSAPPRPSWAPGGTIPLPAEATLPNASNDTRPLNTREQNPEGRFPDVDYPTGSHYERFTDDTDSTEDTSDPKDTQQ